MSRRKFIFVVVIGIAFVAVPFIFRAIDKNNSDKYIREFEVNNDETDEGQEDQSKASGGKKKSSKKIPDGAIGIIEIKSLDICYPIFEGAGIWRTRHPYVRREMRCLPVTMGAGEGCFSRT